MTGGGSDSWGGGGCRRTQGLAAAGAGISSRASLEAQGTLGRGEYEVACWPTPSPAYIEPIWAAEESLCPFSLCLANLAQTEHSPAIQRTKLN